MEGKTRTAHRLQLRSIVDYQESDFCLSRQNRLARSCTNPGLNTAAMHSAIALRAGLRSCIGRREKPSNNALEWPDYRRPLDHRHPIRLLARPPPPHALLQLLLHDRKGTALVPGLLREGASSLVHRRPRLSTPEGAQKHLRVLRFHHHPRRRALNHPRDLAARVHRGDHRTARREQRHRL